MTIDEVGVFYLKGFNSQNVSQQHVKLRPEIFLDDLMAFNDGTIATFTTERIISSIIDKYDRPTDFHRPESFTDYDDVHQFDVEPVLHTYPSKKFLVPTSTTITKTTTMTTPTPITTARSVTIASTTTSTVKPIIRSSTTKSKPTSPKPDANQSSHAGQLFDYLPIDLLKKVHKTLKYQPATIKGKIKFLKAFEQTLIGEIKTRLNEALSVGPSRKPRDARGDWGHDESIGFPSLEGTLMAISFLTFAVYLVRLVMLLFRNVGGTGTAPIFIGRKKRSSDLHIEDTERILGYLSHPFDPDYS
ncbi:hypothetical protein TKK_0010058 [Trichogramma kaykai]